MGLPAAREEEGHRRAGRARGRGFALLTSAVACALLAACTSPNPRRGTYEAREPSSPFARVAATAPTNSFGPEVAAASKSFASPSDVDRFSASASTAYRLGPGDQFACVVRGRPDITREDITVSPDGEIAIARVGVLNVNGLSISEATRKIEERLQRFYDKPEVTLVMKVYNNNNVFVLGRVANPGAVHFTGRGTLMEALALAGGLPVDTQKSFLSRCMIVRGKDMVIWIDLRDLLDNGNIALNARLQNGDIIFIPQSEDQVAYVMGQVMQPGVIVLRSTMTVLDAVMQSGGITRDADDRHVYLVRQDSGKGAVEQIDLTDMVERGDLRKNFVLKDGDIVYVEELGASKFNYYLSRLLPSMDVVDFSIRTAESFGAMQEVRKKLWGQEGFVTPVR